MAARRWGSQQRFLHAPNGTLLAETTISSSASITLGKQYVWANGEIVGVVNGSTLYYKGVASAEQRL